MQSICLQTVEEARMGFSHKLQVLCGNCSVKSDYYCSLRSAAKEASEKGIHELNLRAVTAFRKIGRGHQAKENFSCLMNIQRLTQNGFQYIQNKLADVYFIVAGESMKSAAEIVAQSCDEKLPSDPSITLCECSIDGTWQKRGHASLHGVVTAVSQGKCIDMHVMSKFCKGCRIWEKKAGTQEYDLWKAEHTCSANHSKSSGAMEAAGAVEMFPHSVEKHKLVYQYYIGDGDASSFKDAVASKPYEVHGIVPNKWECVGHIQKHLGTRLRELRKRYKNTTAPLGGKGKLTDKVINAVQNYFGLAIRQNKGQLYAMKKAVGAVVWHCIDMTEESHHQYCPRGEHSWCKWQRDTVTMKSTYKRSINIPKWIHDVLRPVLQDLSADKLLSKCLHGKTPNCNEALNSMIWQKCPKISFVREGLEMSVHSATIEFNDGPFAVHKILHHFGFLAGYYTARSSEKWKKKREQNVKSKMSEKARLRRVEA